MRLSVVIPVYDNWWLTARCLRELERLATGSLPFETIVVDNASSDETSQSIGEFPWVRYIRHETNRNFAGACNAGVRIAEAPVTLLLNNDAYPLGDALAALVDVFDRDEVAIAGGALFFEDGVTQAAGLVVLPNLHWHYHCRNLPAQLEAVNRSCDVLGVSGAAMAVRTRWFNENGGFDQSFVNGFEDVDLCLRAREQGRTIAYAAGARFAHYEAASAGRFAREAENERRFYARWSASMTQLPKTVRGEVGAVAVRADASLDPLLQAALVDLEAALRAFGHPLVRGAIAPWRRFDRRFRRSATIAWFEDDAPVPGLAIGRRNGGFPSMQIHGAVALAVPWLPCVALERVERLAVRRSEDPACTRVGVVGGALDGAARLDSRHFLGSEGGDFACIVHLGLTDDAAFGNVLLARAGLPAVVLATPELHSIFATDTALISDSSDIAENVARLTRDPAQRRMYGRLVAADASRRFSPRRSAIRVVDLLCAARFGLERQADAP